MNTGFCVIAFKRLIQGKHNLALVLLIIHVDKIDDDNAAQVAQTKLSCNRLRRLQIGFIYGFFQCSMTDKTTGVHINCGHGLCLVYHQVTTGFQRCCAMQGPIYFVLYSVKVKYRPFGGVVFDALFPLG